MKDNGKQRKYFGMTGIQVVILAIVGSVNFCMLAIGRYLILGVANRPFTASLDAGQTTPQVVILLSPTVANTQSVFPPTWTPFPTGTPEPTGTPRSTDTPEPTKTPWPTKTPLPTSTSTATATRATCALVAKLEGSGNGETKRITIPKGSVRVVVSYTDSPKPGAVSQSAQSNHNERLRILEDWYRSSRAIWDTAMQNAVANRDATRASEIQQRINDLNAQYSREVDAENQRYATIVSAATSKTQPTEIKVWVYRESSGDSKYLDGWVGSGTQEVYFDTTGGKDYYFRVEAAGSWTLSVYQKP